MSYGFIMGNRWEDIKLGIDTTPEICANTQTGENAGSYKQKGNTRYIKICFPTCT